MTDLILSEQLPTDDGRSIGIITLNNPKALNAQSLDMVKAMMRIFSDWRDDESVVAIVLRGAGERALCAGGDIKTLSQATGLSDVQEFFEHEYELMQTLYEYTKPILAWGHGVVMGGGLGLLSACSHKAVTSETMMAMPEVSIGLFPDAGGSWFLNRMMGKVGLFLGLTGARFSGVDALYLGLADVYVAPDSYGDVIKALTSADWQGDHHGLLNQILAKFYQTPDHDSQILKDFHAISALMNAGSLADVDRALRGYQGDSEFIKSAIENYTKGSDTTKALTWRIYHEVKPYSIAEMFDMERKVAVNCAMRGDFKEGVRALLIDKDKNPKWRYTLADMPVGYIDGFFGDCV
ncbi:enoyl-CoA hydratase/isomerase family protein [Moraxella bovoculi]|uniref:enoyl-CoA hydratase/isomerase family protein n=1 Tax=Moraxella bovoculi TaxID=386891 RepID=UPI003F4F9C36